MPRVLPDYDELEIRLTPGRLVVARAHDLVLDVARAGARRGGDLSLGAGDELVVDLLLARGPAPLDLGPFLVGSAIGDARQLVMEQDDSKKAWLERLKELADQAWVLGGFRRDQGLEDGKRLENVARGLLTIYQRETGNGEFAAMTSPPPLDEAGMLAEIDRFADRAYSDPTLATLASEVLAVRRNYSPPQARTFASPLMRSAARRSADPGRRSLRRGRGRRTRRGRLSQT